MIFAHSVILRVLTARDLGFPPEAGRHLMLLPSSICILGYPVDDAPAIVSWNDHAHVTA